MRAVGVLLELLLVLKLLVELELNDEEVGVVVPVEADGVDAS